MKLRLKRPRLKTYIHVPPDAGKTEIDVGSFVRPVGKSVKQWAKERWGGKIVRRIEWE